MQGIDEATLKQASQLQRQANSVADHLASYQSLAAQKEWSVAGFALDQAQSLAGLAEADVPLQWRIMRATVHLHKNNLDQATALWLTHSEQIRAIRKRCSPAHASCWPRETSQSP